MICLFVCFFVHLFACFFVLIILGRQQEVSLTISWRSNLVWLRYLGSINVYLFVCLFVGLLICLFFVLIIMGHPQEVSLKVSWRSDLIWQRYFGYKNAYLFVCLCLFCFNQHWTSKGRFPESFVKIQFDLAEIFRI